MGAATQGADGLIQLQGPGPEVWVRAADETWLREAGILSSPRPEQLAGARVLSRRGRGSSILVEGPRPLLAKTLRHGGALASILGESFRGAGRLQALRRITQALLDHGVATPQIAFLRIHRSFARCRLEVATDYLAGSRDLDSYLAARPAPRERRQVARSTGRLVAGMHAAGVRHSDLNLRNVLVGSDGGAWVIDLEGSSLVSHARSSAAIADNWARLFRSLVKRGRWPGGREGLQRADLAAALRAAAGGEWRDLARRVLALHRRSAWRHPWTWRRRGGHGGSA